MPFGDVTGALALITSRNERVDILKDIRPVESCLEDLVGRFGRAGVPTIGGRMTMGKDTLDLFLWNATTEDTVCASLEKEGLILVILL